MVLSSPRQNLPAWQKYPIPCALVEILGGLEPAITVPTRMLSAPEAYSIDASTVEGNNKQLLINIKAQPRNGIPIPIKALVDTGAEANLVRTGLLSSDAFRAARNP